MPSGLQALRKQYLPFLSHVVTPKHKAKLLCYENLTKSLWALWGNWFHAGLRVVFKLERANVILSVSLNIITVSFKRPSGPGLTLHTYFICSYHICVCCSASSTYGTTLCGKSEWCHLPSNTRIWTHTPPVLLELHSYQCALRKGGYFECFRTSRLWFSSEKSLGGCNLISTKRSGCEGPGIVYS